MSKPRAAHLETHRVNSPRSESAPERKAEIRGKPLGTGLFPCTGLLLFNVTEPRCKEPALSSGNTSLLKLGPPFLFFVLHVQMILVGSIVGSPLTQIAYQLQYQVSRQEFKLVAIPDTLTQIESLKSCTGENRFQKRTGSRTEVYHVSQKRATNGSIRWPVCPVVIINSDITRRHSDGRGQRWGTKGDTFPPAANLSGLSGVSVWERCMSLYDTKYRPGAPPVADTRRTGGIVTVWSDISSGRSRQTSFFSEGKRNYGKSRQDELDIRQPDPVCLCAVQDLPNRSDSLLHRLALSSSGRCTSWLCTEWRRCFRPSVFPCPAQKVKTRSCSLFHRQQMSSGRSTSFVNEQQEGRRPFSTVFQCPAEELNNRSCSLLQRCLLTTGTSCVQELHDGRRFFYTFSCPAR
ncbi:hypothetical protein BaRGS_00028938 [Batillaria attramentaria]|uniref:Uncharacterized protein n=1 Tax=Batillaria attramentaria TaxID=370345 RepID=A0ABD0JY61_9CAEN